MSGKKIVADITKRILLGETLEEIWFDSYKNLDYARVLIDKFHVDPNIQNKAGSIALIRASFEGNIDIVQFLLQRGADPNIKNRAGHTALYWVRTNEIKDLLKRYDILSKTRVFNTDVYVK